MRVKIMVKIIFWSDQSSVKWGKFLTKSLMGRWPYLSPYLKISMTKGFDIRKGADATERLSQMLEAPIFDKWGSNVLMPFWFWTSTIIIP